MTVTCDDHGMCVEHGHVFTSCCERREHLEIENAVLRGDGCCKNGCGPCGVCPKCGTRNYEEAERLRAFGRKVEAIMDSICGSQQFNWSEHAYPLRLALEKAGFPGKGYEEARKGLGTLLGENARLRAEVEDCMKRIRNDEESQRLDQQAHNNMRDELRKLRAVMPALVRRPTVRDHHRGASNPPPWLLLALLRRHPVHPRCARPRCGGGGVAPVQPRVGSIRGQAASRSSGAHQQVEEEVTPILPDIVCVQCGTPSCFWCGDPDVPQRAKDLAKKLDERRGGHKHRCPTCGLKNINKGLVATEEEEK